MVSKLVYNLLVGLITYLYRGYNPVTKYHGHPSIHVFNCFQCTSMRKKMGTLRPGPKLHLSGCWPRD